MSEILMLEIPEELARQARQFAAARQCRLEDAVVDWITQAVAEPDVESLPDHELLALCDLQLDDSQQAELSELLARQREGAASDADQHRLDQILAAYRQGMVTKARAWRTAVSRGLRSPLSDHAA